MATQPDPKEPTDADVDEQASALDPMAPPPPDAPRPRYERFRAEADEVRVDPDGNVAL